MKLFLPVVLIIALIAFAGIAVKDKQSLIPRFLGNNFVSPFSVVSINSGEASDSAKMAPDSASLPNVSGGSSAGTTHTQNGNTYSSKTEGDKVVMTGNFNLSSYKLSFTFNLPKNGGDITGTMSGACEGIITGTADKPDTNGNANLTGQYSGNCKPIPTLSFQTKASGDFTGTAKYKEGKAGISYSNKEPFPNGGYFELSF